MFAFRNRRGTAVKLLCYDGQGFWLCQKRLSVGRFRHGPTDAQSSAQELLAQELQVLLMGGDPRGTKAAPPWRALPLPRPETPAGGGSR